MNKIKMTEMQKAYYVGRENSNDGTTGTHLYVEILFRGNPADLENALNKVISSQPFLRAHIGENMDFIIDTEFSYKINAIDGMFDDYGKINLVRERLSHKVYTKTDFPFYTIELLGSNGQYRIFLSIDMLIADGLSLYELCREIKHHLNDKKAPSEDRLNDLVYMSEFYHNQRLTSRYFKSRDYYLKKINDLYPAPALRYLGEKSDGKFSHLESTLSSSEYKVLCNRAEMEGLNATDILFTAYALVLSKWSRHTSMSINMTTFLRPREKRYMSVIGDFTTSMLVQASISWDSTFYENAKELKKSIFVSYRHSLFEAPEIVREMSRINPGITMPVVFTSMLFEDSDLWDENFQCDYWLSQTSQVNLDSQVKRLGDKLNITWDYRAGLFEKKQIEEMFSEYRSVINSYIGGRNDVLSEYKQNSIECLNRIYSKYNNISSPDYGIPLQPLKDSFLQTVTLHPNKTFITVDNKSYSFHWVYTQALALSERINAMKKQKNKRKTRIAFIGAKSIDSFINIAAAVISGDSFCIINEDYGDEKRNDTLKALENYVLADNGTITCSNNNALIAEDESYILFTSGTTGNPKGIIISEGAVLNTVYAINKMFSVNEEDVVLNISNLYFDLSIYDIFTSMIVGSEIITVNPMHWGSVNKELIRKVTIWNSTPGLVKEYAAKEKLSNIRLFLMSGDFVSNRLVDNLYGLYSHDVKIVALGGATEASIWSNYFDCSQPHSLSAIPYGHPLFAQQLYILNPETMFLCPQNTLGEICISGAGLADGYLDKGQTKEAFIFHKPLNSRLYRTGDLGYLSYDGNIYIIGRIAQEIKHNGYRIDLREIERFINYVDGVTNSFATIERQTDSHTKLLAAVEAANRTVDEGIRDYLSANLPYYMIPSNILVVKKFPLTHNGKIDTAKLKEWLNETNDTTDVFDAEEKELIRIWKQSIPEGYIEISSRDATYFDAGGQSLQAVKLQNNIEAHYGIEMPLQDMFSNISLRAMVSYIKKAPKTLLNPKKPQNYDSCKGELILLRSGTTNKNIVLIHAGSGEINIYLTLANHIDGQYNVYGIRYKHNMSQAAPSEDRFDNLEQEYDKLLSQLPTIDMIGGWCIGGVIAYKMSLINPQRYRNILMLNSKAPNNGNKTKDTDFSLQSEVNFVSGYKVINMKNSKFGSTYELWTYIVGQIKNHLLLRKAFQLAIPKKLYRLIPTPDKLSAEELVYFVNLFRSANFVLETYTAPDISHSKALYLVASDEPSEGYQRWRNFVLEIEYINIKGDHVTIYEEKNIMEWVGCLNEKLNEILGK